MIVNNFYHSNSIYAKILELPFFFKIGSLYHHFTFLEKLFVNSGARSQLYNFFKLLFNIAIICHIVAIGWHSVGLWEVENDIEDNWLNREGMIDKSWIERYTLSFYWGASTMMLIGTKGWNFYEHLFTTIILFLTVGVFAYTINEIGIIIE